MVQYGVTETAEMLYRLYRTGNRYSNVTIITILLLYDKLVYHIPGCKKKTGIRQNSKFKQNQWKVGRSCCCCVETRVALFFSRQRLWSQKKAAMPFMCNLDYRLATKWLCACNLNRYSAASTVVLSSSCDESERSGPTAISASLRFYAERSKECIRATVPAGTESNFNTFNAALLCPQFESCRPIKSQEESNIFR